MLSTIYWISLLYIFVHNKHLWIKISVNVVPIKGLWLDCFFFIWIYNKCLLNKHERMHIYQTSFWSFNETLTKFSKRFYCEVILCNIHWSTALYQKSQAWNAVHSSTVMSDSGSPQATSIQTLVALSKQIMSNTTVNMKKFENLLYYHP